jgi:hypothetical protein
LDLAQEFLRKSEKDVSPQNFRKRKLMASDYWT